MGHRYKRISNMEEKADKMELGLYSGKDIKIY